MTQADSQATRWHLVYWFDEGSFIVRASDNGQTSNVLFRVRECLLGRHSRCVLERQPEDGWDVPTLTMPPAQLGFHCAASFSLPAAPWTRSTTCLVFSHGSVRDRGGPFGRCALQARGPTFSRTTVKKARPAARQESPP